MSCAGATATDEEEKEEVTRQITVKETLRNMGYIDPNQPLEKIPHFCEEIKNPIILRAILNDLSNQSVVCLCHRNSKVSTIRDFRYDPREDSYSYRTETDPDTVVKLSSDEFVDVFNKESF